MDNMYTSQIIETICSKFENNQEALEQLAKPKNLLKLFNKKEYDIEVFKKQRWTDDALILLISTEKNDVKILLKIHADKFPIASNIYDNPVAFKKLSASKYATRIYKTQIIPSNICRYRLVFSKFIEGKPLGSLLPEASKRDIQYYKELLTLCVRELLSIGFHTLIIRDLDDFLLTGNSRVVITDYDAILDCQNSNMYSRKEIMSLISTVIDNLVSSSYKPPFTSTIGNYYYNLKR